MGLLNSVGNFLEVTQINANYVQVEVYKTKAKRNTLDPYFEKSDAFGLEIPGVIEGLKTTAASGTGSRKVWNNMVEVVEAKIIELVATEAAAKAEYDAAILAGTPPPMGMGSRFPIRTYLHNWAAEVVA